MARLNIKEYKWIFKEGSKALGATEDPNLVQIKEFIG